MKILLVALAVGLSSVPLAQNPVAVEPGRFLVREDAGTWTVLHSGAVADPFATAGRLSTALDTEVVPDVLLELASDPRFAEEWYLSNPTSPTIDVDAEAAWAVTSGEGSVIAVIDTGVDLDHPDLEGQVWVNRDEIDGNGIDDDGNGFVDDHVGWDFVSDDPLPQDETGHGTMVAGVAAGALNGVGTVGLAHGSRVMVLRACNQTCAVSRVVEAIDYALAEGADVINLSLGGGPIGLDPLEDAIRRAGEAGVLVVAAAGNSGSDLAVNPFYPAAWPYPHILSVGASDDADELATFTNYGDEEVDLFAPGVGLLGPELGGSWVEESGTSFAAPLGAAAAAMVTSLRPDLDPEAVVGVLVDTADARPAMADTSVAGGRLDAGGAVRSAAQVSPSVMVSPRFGAAPITVRFDASASKGAIDGATWVIDGVTHPGLSAEITVSGPGVVTGTITLTGRAGDVVTRDVSAYIGALFSDAAQSEFFADVMWASARGVSVGCAPLLFCPDEPVTRGQAAAFLRRGFEVAPATIDAFEDDQESEFQSDLDALAAAGILRGCNPPAGDRVCPGDPLTRAQAAGIIARFIDPAAASRDAFTDDDASVFEEAIDALAATGVLRGCNPPANDRVCPEDPISRAELVALLRRLID